MSSSQQLSTFTAGANLPAAQLTLALPVIRSGDPLGLNRERPPPPPDPDAYDVAAENAEYTRSLLTEKEREALDDDLKKTGFMSVDQVRNLLHTNAVKGSLEDGGVDPELMALIDARVNYKVFVAGDNVYTREELYDNYPFHEFGVQPESVFVAQEIGIFPAKAHSLNPDEFEYVARDVGDETIEFLMVEDMVGMAARANYKLKRAPLRVVKTKFYIGKESWRDFALLQRFWRGSVRMAAAQIGWDPSRPAAAPWRGPSTGGRTGGPLMIEDPATIAAERAALAEATERARVAAEEQTRLLAEERARLAEVQAKVDADLRRLEEMFTRFGRQTEAFAGPAGPAPVVDVEAPPAAPSGEPDGVAL